MRKVNFFFLFRQQNGGQNSHVGKSIKKILPLQNKKNCLTIKK